VAIVFAVVTKLEMGGRRRNRSEGYGLLDRQYSAKSGRNQEYFLTPKGRELVGKLIEATQG
jgi:hypothetical protein